MPLTELPEALSLPWVYRACAWLDHLEAFDLGKEQSALSFELRRDQQAHRLLRDLFRGLPQQGINHEWYQHLHPQGEVAPDISADNADLERRDGDAGVISAFGKPARLFDDKQVVRLAELRDHSENSEIPGSAGQSSALTPLAELAHVVLNSNEFVYIN